MCCDVDAFVRTWVDGPSLAISNTGRKLTTQRGVYLGWRVQGQSGGDGRVQGDTPSGPRGRENELGMLLQWDTGDFREGKNQSGLTSPEMVVITVC